MSVKTWPIFLIILLVYLAAGIQFARLTPAWQAPDEPAHYNYVRALATDLRLPELVPGCYDQAYLDRLKAERFPPDLPVDGICYEFHQPPLYYLLAAPIYMVSDGHLLALRLFSVMLGAGVVALAFFVARTIFPASPVIAYATMAIVAFVPMHVAILGSVNNDALAELILAAILWLLVRRVMRTRFGSGLSIWPDVGLGLVLGLGLITKLTVYIAVPLIGLALFFANDNRTRSGWPTILKQAGIIYGAALIIAAPWYVRNALLYGGFDIFGQGRHDAVVVGQLRTADYIGQVGWPAYLGNFAATTFRSFWGQFGWMAVPMDRRTYQLLTILSLVAVAGLIGFAISISRRPEAHSAADNPAPSQKNALLLLAIAVGLMAAGYGWYNLRFTQFQGRYLFPALIPLACLFALGLTQMLLPRWRWGLVVAVAGGLIWVAMTSLQSGGLDKWGVLILGGLTVLLAAWAWFAPPWLLLPAGWVLGLLLVGLALLTLLSPTWFVVPYLSP